MDAEDSNSGLPLQGGRAGNGPHKDAVLRADCDVVADLQGHLPGLQLKCEALIHPHQCHLGLLQVGTCVLFSLSWNSRTTYSRTATCTEWQRVAMEQHHESEAGADASADAVAKREPLLVQALLMLCGPLYEPLWQETLRVLAHTNTLRILAPQWPAQQNFHSKFDHW